MAKSKVVVGIVAKAKEPVALVLTQEVLTWLKAHNLDYCLDSEVAGELGLESSEAGHIAERAMLAKTADPIVVLGGDGTLISVSRHPVSSPPTIIGVNLGTLGFLTEITVEELFPTLESVLQKRAKVESHPLLGGSVRRDGKSIYSFHATNDAVVTKEALARVFSVDLFVNEEFAASIRGDGVIVATPTGSTAYSMAAGGSIVHPQVPAILITPICPHSLTTRPLVIPGHSKISMRIAKSNRLKSGEVYLTIDGQEGTPLSSGDEVTVTTSDFSVNFVKSPSRSYFEILAAKLKWANS